MSESNPNHQTFVVKVDYAPMSYEQLRRRFSGHVHDGYAHVNMRTYHTAKDIALDERETVFEYLCCGTHANADDAHDLINQSGCRPARFEELIGFVWAYPAEAVKHPIVALGSYAFMGDDDIYVPCVRVDPERGLGLGLWYVGFPRTFPPDLRLLVVRT
ncbi:MAG TPA: hypothetical protein VMU11_02855 [Verrucomicrobiae bacterium]|nr:hypothetical protein [Verrucomicrobiae bacterium]